MSVLLALRFAKLVAVLVFVTGCVGTAVARDAGDRERFAVGLAAPGMTLTWAMGAVLTYHQGVSMLQPWILAAAVLSFFAQGAAIALIQRPARPGRVALVLLVVACVALMVFRPGMRA